MIAPTSWKRSSWRAEVRERPAGRRPRTIASGRARGIWSCAGLLVLIGCDIDFVEPDLPERGAPVVFEATLRVLDGSTIEVGARLAPGLDESGIRRTLQREAMRVLGAEIAPDSVLRNGTRVYLATLPVVGIPADPITLEAPKVEDVGALPPVVRWFGLTRQGPDTVELAPGSDLILTVDSAAAAAVPPPDIRQWTLLLTGAGRAFFSVGSNGVPPDSIVVPARWIPQATDGVITARLTYQQSVQLRPAPGDYVALVLLDTRIQWTVRSRGGGASRGAAGP